ncbi:MAG TPA: glycosyltransferase family 1 protein [Candidatus Limnocylindrales bacterium]|nr:glycosyltransferase family 1 protein [Candidatus Limnocylindrales bacterium]
MIVAVDAAPALRPQRTGTEVYARAILEALARSRGDRILRGYVNAPVAPAWLLGDVEWRPIPFPRLWTHWRFARAIARDRPDVVFVPSHVLPFVLRAPGVATIHDVGHRYDARAYRPADWLYLELTTRWMARRARRLIAVSQATADDLQRRYGVEASRVTVIHSGVDPALREPAAAEVARVREAYALPARYFLYLGRNHPRKNLPFLRRSFVQARHDGMRAGLVLAGPGHPPAAEDGVRALSYVPPQDLPALYAGAIALVLPSRFEGFGFPALEAMRCGTAVIASTAGALPEIVDSAGLLLDPADGPGWIAAMRRLDEDETERQRLIAAGRIWSARFSWADAAAATWRVLEEARDQRAAAR